MRWPDRIRRIRRVLLAEVYPRRLVAEAVFELARARLRTLGPARAFTDDFGALIRIDRPAHPVAAADRLEAARLGRLVEAAGRSLPFRARCLQQSIALRRMLARRGIPAIVHLGVARDHADRVRPDEAAHAWVAVGPQIVSGGGALDRYATVARFG